MRCPCGNPDLILFASLKLARCPRCGKTYSTAALADEARVRAAAREADEAPG